MAPGHRPVMPNVTHKVTTRPSLPPSSSITRQSPQAVAPIQAQAKNSGASVVQETATSATTQPRFRSIAGPIKAGMPNFGQFSANAFLAKKFPGIMPGAGTPIYSPGQLPYMSKAFATGSNTNDSMAGAPGQNNQGSPSNGSGQFSPKPGPKRPSKKRKAKNGSGIASAEAENDLNVMDGFGYLYGFQDAGSAAPGQSANASAYPYHGPVGWASTFNSENRVSATPTDANGSADQSHQHDGRATEQLISPEEYFIVDQLRVIREDGHLADLDLDSHLAILAPPPKDDRLQRASSPSRTQASDDVLQDVASILDPQFTDHSKHYSIVKAENSGHPGIGSNGDAESVSNADDVLQLLQQEFAFSESINSGTQPNVPVNSNPTTEIRSANNGSIVDMHTALFSGNDHAAATNLAAFNDEIFNAPYPSHDPHRSEASSVYHDSGEARLPDFMMDDLTDFAAWSAQAERDFAASEASSQFGTNAHQSPINAFQNPFASKVPVDVTDLDELIQLNAQNDEEQFALDLAAMFNEPRETPHTSSHSTVGQSSVTEDVQMDGGMMNIQELELALQQHANMISTPNATAANHASLPHTQPKIEGPDTPQPEPWRRLSASKDASTDIPTFTGATPTSQARTPSTQHNALYPTCQHEVDIAQTLWALSHLHLPTITLSQLMPQLTRALEILVSLPTCVVCSANPAQTIPQLALLSRTCTTLLRPHPLTPSPLPLVIAGGRTTFTGLSPEIEVHIVDILWANWRSNALQKVFTDLERRVKEEGEKCKIKRQEEREVALSSGEGLEALDITTPEELRCDVMTLALERFRAKVR
ncbi:hypothetical protein QFC19_004447 [Naganishia cerealis]|uniref:Uncharacterized protein n=1 Tax=Naganishia cerealis TaxID=610337 RepID=A0ACC2VWH4_9TREE|nr:hypothetical protein QFC19_004447 [Naganishia cerealis]